MSDDGDDIDDWSFEEDYIDDGPDGADAGPDPDATPDADPQPGLLTRTADGIGRGVGMLIFGTLGGVGRVGHTATKAGFATVDSLLPFSGRMYQSLAEWSVSRLYQQSGGDAIGLIVNDDLSLDLEVAKLCETEVDNDGVKAGGWRTRSRERSWAETAQGRDIARLGKAPIVFLPEPSTRRVAPIERATPSPTGGMMRGCAMSSMGSLRTRSSTSPSPSASVSTPLSTRTGRRVTPNASMSSNDSASRLAGWARMSAMSSRR